MQEIPSNPWVGKFPWRREWQPTPMFSPREFHGQRSLAGYSFWGLKKWDVNERLIKKKHTLPPNSVLCSPLDATTEVSRHCQISPHCPSFRTTDLKQTTVRFCLVYLLGLPTSPHPALSLLGLSGGYLPPGHLLSKSSQAPPASSNPLSRQQPS